MNRTTRSYPGGRPVPGRSRLAVLTPVVVLLGTLALASCSTDFQDDEARDRQQVLIKAGAANPEATQSFSPSPVTILVKTEVLWINTDSVDHQIASVGGLFAAPNPIEPGGQYGFIFNSAGTYRYYCLRPGHREEGRIFVLP